MKGVYGRAEEYFNDAYDSFPKKSNAINKFFQYVPDMYKSPWPPLFQQYVAEMRTEESSRDWIKRHSSIPNGDPSILDKYFFGYRVYEACIEIKGIINNHLNKLFIVTNKLKSGRNETGMFQELRKELWPAHYRRKARESVGGRMKPTGKGKIASIIISTD